MENVLNIKIDRKSYTENTKWDQQISKIIYRFFFTPHENVQFLLYNPALTHELLIQGTWES